MARGRMINQRLATSRKFTATIKANEGAGLLYCLLMPFTDRDGRVVGDPDLVQSLVYPRLEEEEMPKALIAERLEYLDRVGLIQWYKVGDDHFIQIEKFANGQEGMRYDRERASIIPAPDAGNPAVSGNCRTRTAEIEREVEVEGEEEFTLSTGADDEKPQKHKHGEFDHVLLTDEEFDKLWNDWGEAELSRWIKELDEAIEQKGLRYKNHALTLRKWREKEHRGGRGTSRPLPVHDRPALDIPEA